MEPVLVALVVKPPASRTRPLGSKVAVCRSRTSCIGAFVGAAVSEPGL